MLAYPRCTLLDHGCAEAKTGLRAGLLSDRLSFSSNQSTVTIKAGSIALLAEVKWNDRFDAPG